MTKSSDCRMRLIKSEARLPKSKQTSELIKTAEIDLKLKVYERELKKIEQSFPVKIASLSKKLRSFKRSKLQLKRQKTS